MPGAEAWFSPQVLQAVVAGLFLATGWIVAAAQTRRRDAALRQSREDDLQRALLAEIRAHVFALEQQAPSPEDAQALIARIAAGRFVPSLPQQANDRIFAAVIADIHILPAPVIDPVVLYYRLLSIMGSLATDLRRIARHDGQRAAQMMADYLSLMDETRETGLHAMRVLTASLRGGAAEVERMLDADEAAAAAAIAARLPGDLAALRDRLNSRSSDPRGR
ncbi:hypothetical protein D3P06_02825 [Paracoccus aestuarii]|uniref:Uncharacterized protein n=1 Tax=Paracoccus aestuarii TaxID=453842 RepID=A0A419A180_9RHOB|nr:hypothetical protein [Paracoccus aestuarii]RJL06744.1 hypothetical protein D3P06_02825 [Paracoccus aestuarii]WCQ98003.1 hypothetical protein JHW48_08425 [Paracoccus aestuarii]